MIKLKIAERARDDLRNIRAYSKSAFGPVVTRAYIEGLRERFALLRAHAMIGSDEADLGEGLRSIGYRSHRIYYATRTDEVLIVRILHHAREAPRILGQDRT